MKKIIILSLYLIICTVFSACTTDIPQESTQDSNVSTETEENVSQHDSTVIRYSSLEEYINDCFNETDEDVFETDLMTYRVYTDQNALIYDYTYKNQYDDIDAIKENLEASYDPENETTQYLLADLRSHVDVENPKLVFIYRNNDGTVITKLTYE